MIQISDSVVSELQARPLSLKHACLKTISSVVGLEVFARHPKGHSRWDLQSNDMRAKETAQKSQGNFNFSPNCIYTANYCTQRTRQRNDDYLYSLLLLWSINGVSLDTGWWLPIRITLQKTQICNVTTVSTLLQNIVQWLTIFSFCMIFCAEKYSIYF